MSRPADGGGWSWPTYWASLAVLSTLLSLWGLATPMFAVPDEPAHFLKAAAVARGQWIGPPGESTLVRVPPGVAAAQRQAGCFAFQTTVSAACAPTRTASGPGLVDARTQAGRYPPAYYAVVGLPTLVWTDLKAVYAVRGVSAAITGALLAAAVTAAATTGRRLLVVAVGLAATPMAVFLGAGVNPSGPEIAAAVALWTAGTALVLSDVRPIRPVLWTAGLAAVVLTLSRPISPLWAAVVGVVLLTLAGRRRGAALIRERAVRGWAMAVVLAAAAQTAWVLSSGALSLYGRGRQLSLGERVRISLGLADDRLRQMVGWFGWLDTPAPDAVHYAWTGALVALVALGLRRPDPLRAGLLLAVAVAVVAVPVALEVPSVDDVGFYWQGRYTLPLAAGFPVLAAVAASRGRPPTRMETTVMAVVLAVLAVAHVAAFLTALGRYTVGTGQGLGLFDVAWQPPGSAPLLAAAFCLASAGWSAWLLRLVVARQTDGLPSPRSL